MIFHSYVSLPEGIQKMFHPESEKGHIRTRNQILVILLLIIRNYCCRNHDEIRCTPVTLVVKSTIFFLKIPFLVESVSFFVVFAGGIQHFRCLFRTKMEKKPLPLGILGPDESGRRRPTVPSAAMSNSRRSRAGRPCMGTFNGYLCGCIVM